MHASVAFEARNPYTPKSLKTFALDRCQTGQEVDVGTWGVYSEVGRLRTVMVHQPGWEHRRMLPWNKAAMLFDDILDVDFARPEHKELVHKMQNHGVRVLYFADLLKDVCAQPSRHEELVREVVPPDLLGETDPMAIQPTHLIMGYPEVYRLDEPIMLEPLPNLYFQRDPAFFIADKLIVSSPHFRIRRREAALARAVYKRHPMFEGLEIYDGIFETEGETIEGGDVLVADEHTVLVGISERTNEAGVEHLARYLFANTDIEKVGKVFIPHLHEFMHLDTLLTFVDRQQIITLPMFWEEPALYAEAARRVKAQCERFGTEYPGPDPDQFTQRLKLEMLDRHGDRRSYDNVLEGLANEEVIVPEITVTVSGDRRNFTSPGEHILEALREQWNDAANTFALKPGTVLSYSRNGSTRRALEAAMVEVVPFPGGELVRGRGGPRCMTMPVERDGVGF
ncbi:hypothetical protein GF324_03350 [bacterium]|nr:hypothetical protein [bacterium]